MNAISKGKSIVAATGNDARQQPDYPGLNRNPSSLALYAFVQPGNARAGVYDDGAAAKPPHASVNQWRE